VPCGSGAAVVVCTFGETDETTSPGGNKTRSGEHDVNTIENNKPKAVTRFKFLRLPNLKPCMIRKTPVARTSFD
jgi:hypothetical protein